MLWQHFKVNDSVVPPKRLALADLSPDTKIMRCEKTNALWQQILTWTPDSNVLWLRREVGTFLRIIKDAQRSGKKINLRSNAKVFRPRSANPSSHDEVCVFVHFLPEFKVHTTEKQLVDLRNRMVRGYLDKELNEKTKPMDSKLVAADFRFLSMITGQQSSKVQGGIPQHLCGGAL